MKEDMNLGVSSSQLHPLLIPMVAEKVFSNLGNKDLLSVRSVCMEWSALGTNAYTNRKTVEMKMNIDQDICQHFIDVMSQSKHVPVVRMFITVDLFDFSPTAFLDLLTFIPPFVRWMKIAFNPWPIMQSRNEENEVSSLLSLLEELDPQPLRLPALEEFIVIGGADTYTPPLRDAVIMVTQLVMGGASVLHTFGFGFPFDERDGVSQGLPKVLRGLHAVDLVANTRDVQDVPYSAFMDFGFELTELTDTRHNLDGIGLVDFLSLQKRSLQQLHVDKLEIAYRQSYPNFPRLNLVDKLCCEVNCNSTFEFLHSFPNLVELTISVTNLTLFARGMKDIWNNPESLPQHPSVRKLHISEGFLSLRTMQERISFVILSHCFPNLTHLSTPTGGSGSILTDIFTRFTKLEWLYIDVSSYCLRPGELEYALSGIPVHVCAAMKAAGSFEDTREDASYGAGLPNLKSLQTLEVSNDTHDFEFLFTDFMLQRVFLKMESLTKICFVEEDNIPEVCLSFVEPLRTRRIDLYRMKSRVDGTF